MDIKNRLVVVLEERVGRRIEWEVGVSKCKLLYIGWINKKSSFTAFVDFWHANLPTMADFKLPM